MIPVPVQTALRGPRICRLGLGRNRRRRGASWKAEAEKINVTLLGRLRVNPPLSAKPRDEPQSAVLGPMRRGR